MVSKMITVAQAAERLQVPPRAVLREIKAGRLIAVVINDRGDFRISEDDLAAWVTQRTKAVS